MEEKILRAILDSRSNFDKIDSHIEHDDLTPEGAIILKGIRAFYAKDPDAKSADIALVKARVLRGLANPKHKDMFLLVFQRIEDAEVSGINVVDELLEAKRETAELALAEAIHAKDRGRIVELVEYLQTLNISNELDSAVHEEYQNLDAEALLDVYDANSLIKVAPRSLNRRLNGGLLRGHHIVVVAYPETGKTALVLTMINGFVRQGLKVLYVGNEDPIKSIIRRFISCLIGWKEHQVQHDPQGAVDAARRVGYDKAVFTGLSEGGLAELRSLVAKHEPDVLVVDQIRNLTAKAENRTNQLEEVARGMRVLAREGDLVAVSVTQGADSSRDKLVLDMGDVDGSNVGIPGAADVMVMIGMNNDYDNQDRRMLTLAKNKVGGVHTHWPVGIRRDLSRYVDYAEEKK